MKFLAAVLVSLAALNNAQADGFVCQTQDGALRIAIYNHTSNGTRIPATMILSSPQLTSTSHTIARYNNASGQLTSKGGTSYVVQNDVTFDQEGGGYYLAGTRLGYVQTLRLIINFSYSAPVPAGEQVGGALLVFKRNGTSSNQPVVCARYLKRG